MLHLPTPRAQAQAGERDSARAASLTRIVVGLSLNASAVALPTRPLAQWEALGPFAVPGDAAPVATPATQGMPLTLLTPTAQGLQ